MLKPGLSARRRMLAASVAISALTLAFTLPAASFVETAMAVGGLASSLLSAGGKGSDITATAILATMKMVEALHQRMDEVDASLAFIMTQLKDIKKDIRDELEHDRDINRSESVSGKTDTMIGLLKDLAVAQKRKHSKEIERKKAEIDSQYVTLQNARNALKARTDFVLPTMISTMVTEISALKAVDAPQNEIRRVLGEYDDRLAMAQNPSREGSLPYIRQELETQQSALAQEIATKVEGGAKTLVSGTFSWVVHTKVHNETDTYMGVCGVPSIQKFDGNEHAIPIPVDPEPVKPQELRIVPCPKTETVPVEEHSRQLERVVSLSPLNGSNAAGIFTLAINYSKPVQTKPIAGAQKHSNSDEEFERDLTQSDETLKNKVKEFNDRSAAILRVEQLQNIVSTARGLIVRWDEATAGQTVAFADLLGSRSSEAVDLIEQDRRDAAVSDRIAQQDTARRDAWKVVEDARNQVSQAIERAEREKWRSEWVAGLSIFRASLQTYITVDREYFSSLQSNRTPSVSSKKAAAVANGASGTIDAGASHGGSKGLRAALTKPAQPEQNGVKSSVERTAEAPARIEDNYSRVNRVNQIIEEVGHKKLDYWTKLPNVPTHEELLLLEGMEHLDKMGDTEADRFVREEQVTPGSFAGDIATGAASEGAVGAAHEAMKDVIKPTIVADDTLLGEQSRNALRKQLNDLYRPYFIRRFVDSAGAGTDYSHLGDDVCMSKDGCVMPGRR